MGGVVLGGGMVMRNSSYVHVGAIVSVPDVAVSPPAQLLRRMGSSAASISDVMRVR